MIAPGLVPEALLQRLCSEVKLFDLCDLDSCKYKNGRFCSDPIMLSLFEKIAEEDFISSDRYVFEDVDDVEVNDGDEDGYEEEFSTEDSMYNQNNDCECED